MMESAMKGKSKRSINNWGQSETSILTTDWNYGMKVRSDDEVVS